MAPESYAVRIRRSAEELSGVFLKLMSVCSKVVVYEHPDENNIHCHMLLMECTVSTDSLKNYIKKIIGQVERQDWSFKSGANMEFISYMSKGKYDAKYVYGVSDTELSDYKAKGYDVKDKRNNNGMVKLEDGKLVRQIKEGAKRTRRELIELMRANIDVDDTTYNILKGIRKVLIQNNEVIGKYKIIEYYDAFLMYGNEQRWLDIMTTAIERRDNPR